MTLPLFKALLVDDEALPRLRLRQLLGTHPDVRIVGEAASVTAAADAVRDLAPDVIFLDVQMPRRDGFSLLPLIAQSNAQIIFVTSHDRFALRGFEIAALDYLLKPVDPGRLGLSIQRLRKVFADRTAPAGPTLDDLLVLGNSEGRRTTSWRDISCLQAEGNYSRVHFADGNEPMLVLRSLAEWERMLEASTFCRVDRKLIVNLRQVRRFSPQSRDASRLLLQGLRDHIALGRAASARLRAALSALGQPES